ncbi:MAG: S9 family peptidase [Candidatus Aminicenantes bacterium]|nr:MAG: S9 family peptidase [Candidatus Aminicenantes bacterium]
MTRTSKILILSLGLVLVIGQFYAAGQDKSSLETQQKLTIDQIMQGESFVGSPPNNIMWSIDSQFVYFRWKKPGEEKVSLYRLSPKKLVPEKIKPSEMLTHPPISSLSGRAWGYSRWRQFGLNLVYDRDRQRALLLEHGDISLLNVKTGQIKLLLQTDEPETRARFCFDQQKITFVVRDNLFLYSLKDGQLIQLTSFTRKKPPEKKAATEIEKWYRAQQRRLFKEFQPKKRPTGPYFSLALGPKKQPRKPFYLQEKQNVYFLELSPDETKVIFFLSEPHPSTKLTLVPKFVTRSGYTETISSHAKAADITRLYRAGIMSVKTGQVTWIDYGQGERLIIPRGTYWSPDGQKCLLLGSSEDRKDIWLWLLNLDTGQVQILEHVHDSAWIGRFSLTNIIWWPDSQTISYISEKNGFAHLYQCSLQGYKKALTSGNFEVSSAWLSQDGQYWYLITNEKHPGETHLYRMPRSGGPRQQITQGEGRYQVYLSPDEKYLALLFSTTNHPPELYLQKNSPQAKPIKITESTTPAFRAYHWVQPEIITFKARDGFTVYARLYKPQKWHSEKPAVIFIHGAGYLQNAHKGWSSYYREYMFHNFLLEHGYLVLDIDYRGSAGYGRDCRTAIYRHMGGKDLDDIVDGAKFLVDKMGANPHKIGVYGGSYGGFLTLMAMFTQPDVFAAGAALRPVTDWAHYHPGYTVDILNRPHLDPEAYEKSSPIYFAEGLKGALLICHGMVDTNVHFQDTVRLVQRLIELGKENWQVAIYPVEGHAFHNPSSWADEYKRIFKLFEEHLK